MTNEIAKSALALAGLDTSIFKDNLVPRTRTRTSHDFVIVVDGRIIGAVQELAEGQSRSTTDVWELHRNQYGVEPANIVPGINSSRTLRIRRFDLFTAPFEEVFGDVRIASLADQSRPFTLRTRLGSPGMVGASSVIDTSNVTGKAAEALLNAGVSALGREIWEYNGCYFTQMDRVYSVDGNRLVGVDAQITYQSRRLLS